MEKTTPLVMLPMGEWAGQSPVAITLALIAFLVALYFSLTRKKYRAPPLVPYWMPWLGSAITLGKNPDKFFTDATRRFGPMFRIKAAGKEMTYVTSPELIQVIYRDNESFQFTPIRQEMQHQLFQLPLDVSYSEELTESFFPAHHRALSPANVRDLLASYTPVAFEHISVAFNQIEGSEVGTPLASVIAPTTYCTTAKTFYGVSYPAESTFASFSQFNDVFHFISTGVPLWLLPKARRGWEAINSTFVEHLRHLRQSKEKLTDIMDMAISQGERHGWSNEILAGILAIQLWALEANTTWALYWSIAFLLQSPEAMRSVLAELDAARARWIASFPDTPLTSVNFHEFMQGCGDQLPLLTSSIQESLRLRSSTFSIRRVGAPTEFAGYRFNVGDYLICNIRALHVDERNYDNPHEFVWDRYTDAGRKRAVQGGRSPTAPFLPFGGGISMCEGRHFAMGALKTFLAILLTFYTIELDPKSDGKIPEPQMDRIGVGVVGPKGDANIFVKRRQH